MPVNCQTMDRRESLFWYCLLQYRRIFWPPFCAVGMAGDLVFFDRRIKAPSSGRGHFKKRLISGADTVRRLGDHLRLAEFFVFPDDVRSRCLNLQDRFGVGPDFRNRLDSQILRKAKGSQG